MQISLLLCNTKLGKNKKKKKEGSYLNPLQCIDFTRVYENNQTAQLRDSVPKPLQSLSHILRCHLTQSYQVSISDTDDISDNVYLHISERPPSIHSYLVRFECFNILTVDKVLPRSHLTPYRFGVSWLVIPSPVKPSTDCPPPLYRSYFQCPVQILSSLA